jgi:hypothetical protein
MPEPLPEPMPEPAPDVLPPWWMMLAALAVSGGASLAVEMRKQLQAE